MAVALGHDLSITDFVALYDSGALSLPLSPTFSVRPSEFVIDGLDPRSAGYADKVIETWAQLTGRTGYDPTIDEAFNLDVERFIAKPYPYSSEDPVEVGRYFAAVGWFLLTTAPPPSFRIVEFGAGWGHLATALAATGYDVTAVDLNTASVEVLRARVELLGIPLTVAHNSFLDYDDSNVDMVIFFEAFHHCAEPLELLDRCTEMLNPGGQIVFLAEAIYDDFYCPWGVRLDGSATYMARDAGWLELGFNRSFMYRELNARGFALSEHRMPELGPYGFLDIGVLGEDGDTFSGVIAPDEEATWNTEIVSIRPGRLSKGHSRVSLCENEDFDQAVVRTVNLCDVPLRVAIAVGSASEEIVVGPGEHAAVTIALTSGRRLLEVVSDDAPSSALGSARVGICVQSVRLTTAATD